MASETDPPCAALFQRQVPALAGRLAVDEGLLPGLGQVDQGEAAEAELTAAATDGEALNPVAGSGRLGEEVEAIAVGMSSGRSGGSNHFRHSVPAMDKAE